jgi:hypothetical protein
LPTIVTTEDQRAAITSGLGKYELEMINRFNVPLIWSVPLADGTLRYRNGTAFFLNPSERPFGVTASHVITGWEQSRVENSAGPLHLAGHRELLEIDWAARVIDDDPEIDIATFAVTEEEVRHPATPPGRPALRRGAGYGNCHQRQRQEHLDPARTRVPCAVAGRRRAA